MKNVNGWAASLGFQQYQWIFISWCVQKKMQKEVLKLMRDTLPSFLSNQTCWSYVCKEKRQKSQVRDETHPLWDCSLIDNCLEFICENNVFFYTTQLPGNIFVPFKHCSRNNAFHNVRIDDDDDDKHRSYFAVWSKLQQYCFQKQITEQRLD